MKTRVTLIDAGVTEYGKALSLQRELFEKGGGYLILCEHPHVYTLGKSGKAENMLVSEEFLRERGVEMHRVERGGDVTYHGPGQIVGYPILDLAKIGMGLREYIEALEQSVIETVAQWGIKAGRSAGKTGVWIKDERGEQGQRGERKICAIGVRASRGIVMHGFALNVATDLGWFEMINPCGFVGGAVTSMEAETGGRGGMEAGGRVETKEVTVGRVGVSGRVEMEEVKRVLCGRLEENLRVRLEENSGVKIM